MGQLTALLGVVVPGMLAVAGCGSTVVLDGEGPTPVQAETQWTYIDDTAGNDMMRSLAFDSDGNVLAIGAAAPGAKDSDTLLVKLDSAGEVVFRKLLGSPSDGHDAGRDVMALGTDIVALSGMDSTTTLARYDSAGNEVWVRQLLAAEGYAITPTEDGSIVITGRTNSAAGVRVPWLMVLNGAGETVSENSYDTGVDSGFSGPAIDDQDRVVVVYGEKDSPDALQLRRYNLEGQLEHSKSIDCGGLVAASANGRVATVIAGELVGTGVRLCMHSSNFDQLWQLEVVREGANYIGVQGLSFDGRGNVIVSGFAGLVENAGTYEMFVRKYDSDGQLLWDKDYAGPDELSELGFGYGFGVAANGDRHTVVAGLLAGPSLDNYAAVVQLIED